MKLQQGLNLCIQDYVACQIYGRLLDNDPKTWYAATILCDKKCIANKPFRASLHLTPLHQNTTFKWSNLSKASNMADKPYPASFAIRNSSIMFRTTHHNAFKPKPSQHLNHQKHRHHNNSLLLMWPTRTQLKRLPEMI